MVLSVIFTSGASWPWNISIKFEKTVGRAISEAIPFIPNIAIEQEVRISGVLCSILRTGVLFTRTALGREMPPAVLHPFQQWSNRAAEVSLSKSCQRN